MSIKDLLENYNNYTAEIKTKEHLIKKIELEEVTISGSNFEINGDIRPKGYMASNIENKIIKRQDKILILKKEIEELKSKIEMIDSYINTLDDYYRRVIELKYKYNKKPAQIGTILYRGKRAINIALKNAIKELDIKYMKEFPDFAR